MGEVAPPNGKQPVARVARAQDPLSHVPATSRFRSWIPKSPPLHSEVHAKSDGRDRPDRFARWPARKIGKKGSNTPGACTRRILHRSQFGDEATHTARRRPPLLRYRYDDSHLQHKLKKIGP